MKVAIHIVETSDGKEVKREILTSEFHEVTSEIIYVLLKNARETNPGCYIRIDWEENNADQDTGNETVNRRRGCSYIQD